MSSLGYECLTCIAAASKHLGETDRMHMLAVERLQASSVCESLAGDIICLVEVTTLV